MTEIRFELLDKDKRKEKIPDDQLGFGKNFTDHMFFTKYEDGQWVDPVIKPLENFSLHPGALVFHYGQEIFEGMKCFRHKDKKTLTMFRPDQNIARFNRSAKRMCMPPIDEELFMEGLVKLLQVEKDWVPMADGTALYIRPTMIATQTALGVKESNEYYFYIILSPVGPYFKEGFKPTKILVETQLVRAVQGGVGDAKTGGNYAASLLAGKRAKERGYSQVLWLDACEREYIEEVGAMNMAFVVDGKVVTPPLTGSILPGITRDSVIKLCEEHDIPFEIRKISIHEIIDGIKSGKVTEAFGMGTAASITPVGALKYRGEDYEINDFQIGPITEKLYEMTTAIKRGVLPDNNGWNVMIPYE